MKLSRLGLSIAFLLPACASLPESSRSVARYDARTLYATTSFTGASFSHDGERLLVTSDQSGIFNVYSLALDGGELVPLTRSESNATFAVDWFLDDDRFLYTADEGGNELNHLYVQYPSGESVDLTPGERLKARFAGWNGDRRSFFVRTNERDPQFFDLYRYRFDGLVEAAASDAGAPGFERELLYQNPGGYDLSGVSRDGRWVALTKSVSNADSDIYLARTDEPDKLVHVTPHEGDVAHGFADFAPDGSKLYYTSNEGGEFDRAWAYDVATGERAPAFSADWDVTAYSFSDDGRWLSTAVNADARTVVRVFEVASGREVELPELPDGDITGVAFEREGELLACYVNGDTSPSNLYLVDLAGGDFRRLTNALDPAIDERDLVAAEVVRYTSFDGLAIPALLYRPKQASATNRAPALVWVHGGPGGQSRHGYSATLQHLVNHGYAVLAVNNRGSAGYGKSFYHLDDRKHGDVDLQDCIQARRYLEGLPWVDGSRVGIMGGSYGGYMVCAALAFAPDAFDVGIDIFGVTNWIRTLESIPPWWAAERDALYAELGDPAADRASLEARSPLVHAARIQRPMLVIQGKNDPRVLEAESEEIVAALKENGVPVEYVLFPDEGHGFRSKENRIRASEAYLAFLEEHLRKAGSSATAAGAESRALSPRGAERVGAGTRP
jgi:dipeptidyl aminopeptidase/acylaminoacyl peptidase